MPDYPVLPAGGHNHFDVHGGERDAVTSALAGLAQSGHSHGSDGLFPWHNVLDYGAAGTGTIQGGGADDTQPLQDAYTAAGAAGGYAAVVLPGRRAYRITSTLNIPVGVHTIGLGGQYVTGSGAPPRIIWGGATDAVMAEVVTSSQNIPETRFQNVEFWGRDVAATCLRFRHPDQPPPAAGSGGSTYAKPDTGTNFIDVRAGNCRGDAIRFDGVGITNGYWLGGRFDQVRGYCIFTRGFSTFFSMKDFTVDNGIDGTTMCEGVFYWGGDLSDATGMNGGTIAGQGHICRLSVEDAHLEVNASLTNTNPSGSADEDKRGLFRFGVNPAINHVQALLRMTRVETFPASGTAVHSLVHITGGDPTTTEHPDRVLWSMFGPSRVPSFRTKLVGNVPTAWKRTTSDNNIMAMHWGRGFANQEAPRYSTNFAGSWT